MTSYAYFVGRAPASMHAPFEGSDLVFGGQRLDGQQIRNAEYEHCTFANLSFKDTTIDGGRFANCVFVACYFRNTNLRSCNFASCRFIECEFPKAGFSACDFSYTRFVRCYIPFAEMEHCLPQQPNLRRALSHNLAREAAKLGDGDEARSYHMCEISARDAHYRAALAGKSKWYRDHFDVYARIGILGRVIASSLSGYLFGHGERITVVVRNYLAATLVIFPLLFFIVRKQLEPDGASASILAILQFSLSNGVAGALDAPFRAVGVAAQLAVAAQSVLTAVWVSLVAAYLFRWSLRR